MNHLTWSVLKSRDSAFWDVSKNRIEIWNDRSSQDMIDRASILSIPIESCAENASRCLHLDMKWRGRFECPDCKQTSFFGSFDVIRWIIRQIQLGKSDIGSLLAETKSHLYNDWEFSCEDLVQEAIQENVCQECQGLDEICAGCYLCDAEAAGADHTHSHCDSYFHPCKCRAKTKNEIKA